MYREHHGHDVDAAEEVQQDEVQEIAAAPATTFTSHGEIPPVESEMPAPVQPQHSPSERAMGTAATQRAPASADRTLTSTMTRVVHGIKVIAPPGTHAEAIQKVADIIELELGNNEYAQTKMAEANASIVIIPARSKMTDVPQFAGLRGQRTFDGRDWSTVRGSGGMRAPDGSFAIGVAEENLLEVRGVASSYAKGYSIAMHELAHAVQEKGMSPEQRATLTRLYQQQASADRGNSRHTFTDDYAASNEREYFAQATNAFFGRNAGWDKNKRQNANGREWLRTNDPDMYAFLVDMYEHRHAAPSEDRAN